jgi:hypothetical protein
MYAADCYGLASNESGCAKKKKCGNRLHVCGMKKVDSVSENEGNDT